MASYLQIIEQQGMPQAIHAENTVLGACIYDEGYTDAMHSAMAKLVPSDFSLESHQAIFKCLVEMVSEGKATGVIQVADELKLRGRLDSVGGIPYLSFLTEGIPRHPNIEDYARIIVDKSIARRGIRLLGEAQTRLASQNELSVEVLDSLAHRLLEERPEDSISASELMPLALATLDQPEGSVISTGIPALDKITNGGMRTKELWIIGALPSRGKSSLARQLERGAIRHFRRHELPHGVHTHTVEMAKEDWINLHAFTLAEVPAWKMRQPRMITDLERERLIGAAARISQWNQHYDDKGGVHIDTLLAKSRLSAMRHKTKVHVVDYIQLLQGDEKEIRHRMATIALGLKQFAKDYDCCVVALSQLARRGDINAVPTMQDLKESGDLEAAADVVLLNYRPVDKENERKFTGEDEIIVGKQRNGGIGTLPMHFDSDSYSFYSRKTNDNEAPPY